MKKQTMAAVLISGLIVCSLGAAAAPRLVGGEDEARPWRMLIRGQIGRLMTLQSELEVTAEQREQIKQILQGHRAEIAATVQPIVEKRRALRDATLAKDSNEAAIRSAANDLGKAIGDASVLASKIKGEVGKVWTSDQQQKLDDFRKQSDLAVDNFVERIAKQL